MNFKIASVFYVIAGIVQLGFAVRLEGIGLVMAMVGAIFTFIIAALFWVVEDMREDIRIIKSKLEQQLELINSLQTKSVSAQKEE